MGSCVADSVGLQELGEKYVDWCPHVSSGQVVHLNLLFEKARQQGADVDGLVADLLRAERGTTLLLCTSQAQKFGKQLLPDYGKLMLFDAPNHKTGTTSATI